VTLKPSADPWGDQMRAALAGDAAAYRALLAAVAPHVRAVVRRAFARGGRGNGDVEDVVQDVLLAVHLKRHTWNQDLPFAPWLGAVARHKTIDALRRQGGRADVPVDDLAEVLADTAVRSPSHGDAERMLATLGDTQARIVRAMTMEDRPAAEIGRELGMTEGAVRVALHRALKTLAARFGSSER
jgi:RNA polymerase sigma-70 factor (ECF subfamily)